MTIEYRRGDIFASGAEAIVCAANAQGRLGAGQALEVRRRFPEQTRGFCALARQGKAQPGMVLVGLQGLSKATADRLAEDNQPPILFAVTKDDPHKPSEMQWVVRCAVGLALIAERTPLESVAIPALGCGLGGLPWSEVQERVGLVLGQSPVVRWFFYEPLDALRVPLANAIAAAISSNIIRANAWIRDNGVRVYLAIDDRRIGWIGIDAGLGLHAGADTEAKRADVRRWVSAAEEVKRKMLMDHG